MEKYDMFLFGNGLTLELFSQLNNYVDTEYQYLLKFDDFLQKYIFNDLQSIHQNRINKFLSKGSNIDIDKKNFILRNEFGKYYNKFNCDFEYNLCYGYFRKEIIEYDFDIVQNYFPVFYNLWHNMVYEYFENTKILKQIQRFNQSIQKILNYPTNIYTTNFDLYFESLKPKHIHGKFIKNLNKIDNIILEVINHSKSKIDYKTIWGYNGYGKYGILKTCYDRNKYSNLFAYDFLFDSNLKFNNIIIYGLSFSLSAVPEKNPDKLGYESLPFKHLVNDNHILFTICDKQKHNENLIITFAYYDEKQKEHFEKITQSFNLKNVNYIHSSEFKFTIK